MIPVVIVDDEEIIRNGIKNMTEWAENGFKIVGTADDGVSALPLVKRLNPALLITDISMPSMNGLVLIENIRKFDTDINIIILSGYDLFEYAKQAMIFGVGAYVLKPVDNEELIGNALRLCGGTPREKPSNLFDGFPSDAHPIVLKAYQYMYVNYMLPLLLTDLAATLQISPFYLSRLIKKAFGFGFVELLASIRITHAKLLLEDSDLKISDISEMVGYLDSSYFCGVFKQQTGKTPYEYRRDRILDAVDIEPPDEDSWNAANARRSCE